MCKVVGGATAPDYASIKLPTLILAGEEDKSAPLTGCEDIQERIGSGNKQFKVVEKMGHWHCIERPELMIECIGNFVGEIT